MRGGEPVKILILGEAEAGKTCLQQQMVKSKFPLGYKSSIGVEFGWVNVTLDENNNDSPTYRIQIWDTAGNARDSGLIQACFRGTNAAIIVFDATEAQSFNSDKIKETIEKLRAHEGSAIPIFLVANTRLTDKTRKRQIEQQTAVNFARDHNLHYRELDIKDTNACKQLLHETTQAIDASLHKHHDLSLPNEASVKTKLPMEKLEVADKDTNKIEPSLPSSVAVTVSFWHHPIQNLWKKKYVNAWNRTHGNDLEKAKAVLRTYIATGLNHHHTEQVKEIIKQKDFQTLMYFLVRVKDENGNPYKNGGDLALAIDVIDKNEKTIAIETSSTPVLKRL